MKKLILVLVTIMYVNSLYSQTNSFSIQDTIPAKFKTSSNIDDLRLFIQQQIIYPASSAENCEQGTSIIKFQITTEAKIDSIEILNDLSRDLNIETIRCLKKTESHWTAAEVNGKKISCNFIIPVVFIVENSCKNVNYFIRKGKKSYDKMDYVNALENFKEAIKLNPMDIDVLEKKIDCEKKLNLTEALVKDYKLLEFVKTVQ